MVWMGPQKPVPSGPPVIADGLFGTTPVATPDGWLPAAELVPGDAVLTFDGGVQQVTALFRAPFLEGPADLWPLRVPVWALDNRDEMILLPQQKVLIESDQAELLFGDPFALIPADALEHWRGIARFRPSAPAEVVQLRFDRPQVIYASRGVLLSCAGEAWEAEDWTAPAHTVCSQSQARHLVACLMAEEAGAAIGQQRLQGD